ncbi:MAG: hypothetical protein O3B24_03445 [Verrucomicrobia bacterium]|nr:hypothetical protein [Verrucomicrobiota bacterium]
MRPIQPFFALTGLTAVEAIRQPILVLLFTACVTFTAVTPMVLLHTFGEYGKMARETGLALHFLLGLLAAVQAAASSLAQEVRSGTAAVVLSKPVGRHTFFLAKFTGIALVILAFSLGAALATLLSERVAERLTHTAAGAEELIDWRTAWWLLAAPLLGLAVAGLLNYTRRVSFGSTAFLLIICALLLVLLTSGAYDRTGARASFDLRVDWRVLPAGVLITAALLVISAVAVSLSTRLRPAPTLALCGLIFILGLLWEYLFGQAPTSPLSGWLYSIAPNWQHFWVSDALTGGGTIPWSYVGQVMIYAATYIGAILCLGTCAFARADV